MSSAGQVVGGIVGGVIGFFAGGNVMLGVSIGASIGGYIDPPKGANSVGPRLEDLTVQTSTYGAVLPRIKGTVAVTGNVFWLEGNQIKEHAKTEKVGGKGGPTAKQTTFSYTATFAVGLSHQISAPVSGIRRLWLANTLVYDAGSGDLNSIIASNQQAGVMFRFYDGRDDQEPDPRMQADKGVANVSGYPGRCYIVFYDLDLTEKYNNTLIATQAKVELVCGNTGATSHYPVFTTPDVDSEYFVVSAVLQPSAITYAVIRYESMYGIFYGVDYYEAKFGEYIKKVSALDHLIPVPYGMTGVGNVFISHNRDGQVHVIAGQGNYLMYLTYFTFISGGAVISSVAYHDSEIAYGYYDIAACDLGYSVLADTTTSRPVISFNGAALAATSAVSVKANYVALSENRVFIANYAAGTTSTTVTVLDRVSLALIANYTQSVNGFQGVLNVVSDTEFYLAAGDDLSHWVNGVAENLGAVLHTQTGNYPYRWVSIQRDPDYFISFEGSSGNYTMSGILTNYPISAQVAKLRTIVTEECALAGILAADLDLTELVDSDVRGYRVSSAGSVRTVLEQFQAAFPFDVIQSGYKLKFKSRGGASVLTVPESDLGAHTGNDTPSRFMLTTEMPSQVPAKVTFNFLNADREYDPDEQSAAFTAQDVKNSYTVSLPLVMTPTEAFQAADVLLKKEQRERTTAGTFWLPPTDDYRKLEAADVIDVIAQGRTHTIRLTKVTQLPDGRVECDGKMTSSAAYASTAQAQNSLALGQTTVPLAGSSELLLLDIPRLVSDQDVPGITLGMYGYTSGWPGGVAMRSDDFGESYSSVVGFSNKVEVFSVSETPASVQPYTIDHVTSLTVTPGWVGADLVSITETQLYALGNMAAYGADGRWEIVCFKTVIDNGNGTYTLRDFLRGRFGTEWAMSLHASGDLLVMLDIARIDFAGLPTSAINSSRLWRGVTAGASLDSSNDISKTYSAVNLLPLAPVDLTGGRDQASKDWTISATRRSRWPVELFSGSAVPLGETIESYELETWDATYENLKRTLSASTPSFQYSLADQVADYGAESATVYCKMRQVSSVVGRGYPAISALTRNLDDDPYLGSVVFGCHFDGTAGSTTFTDVKGATITPGGNAQMVTDAAAFGGISGGFDGAGDYLQVTNTTNHQFGTGDLTIDGFVTLSSLATSMGIFDKRSALQASGLSIFFDSATSKFNFVAGDTSIGSWEVSILSGVVTSATRYHLQFSRGSNVWYAFVNGVLLGSVSWAGTVADDTSDILFGIIKTGVYALNGKLDDWRITKSCRNTTTFTPRTSAFPNP